ncbi:MAG: TlpA disulfide reductase family protein [Chloroflexi bacterium]|nr:TlpA disulfide reductase family protein [Chloroflexota bacterium]
MSVVKSGSRLRTASFAALGSGLMLLAGAGAVGLGRLSSSQELPSAVPIEADYPAPELSFVNLADKRGSLSDFRGPAVLVNLWATWCPLCLAEMPVLAAAARDHASQGLVVLALNQGESQEVVSDFVERSRLALVVGLDPHEEAMRLVRTTALPSSYVVDAQGQVRLAWFGAIDRDHLEAALARVGDMGGLP